MPQITLEYSSNIGEVDTQALFGDIHEALKGITDINTCKSRATRRENFRIGRGEPENAFIHLKLELLDLAERNPEFRKSVGAKIATILERHFRSRLEQLGLKCKPTVHVAKLKIYVISDSPLHHTSSSMAIAPPPSSAPYARL